MASDVRLLDARLIVILISMTLLCAICAFAIMQVSQPIALVVTVGIAVVIVCFVWPPIALYILVFSMLLSPEFGERATQGKGFTIRIDDLLLVLISFTWFAKSSLYKELGLFPKTPLNRWIIAYTGICFFSTILGGLFGKINIVGLMFALKYFEYFIVFFMAVNFINTRQQLRTFVILLLIVCAIVCFVAMSQFPLGGRVTAPFEGKEGEPGTLGGYLILMLSVSLGLFLTSESRKGKVLLSGLMLITIVSIVATQSRATWLGLPFMYLCFIIMSKKKLLLLAALVILIAIGPFIIPQNIKERYGGTFEVEKGYQAKIGGRKIPLDSSATLRVQSWQGILKDIKTHPIFGYGITGYWFIDAQYFRTLIELGIVGLSIYLFFMYRIARFLLEAHRIASDSFGKGLTMGLFAGFISLLVHAIGSNTFIIVRVMEPFWFLMGLVVVLYYIDKKKLEALQNESNVQETNANTAVVHR